MRARGSGGRITLRRVGRALHRDEVDDGETGREPADENLFRCGESRKRGRRTGRSCGKASAKTRGGVASFAARTEEEFIDEFLKLDGDLAVQAQVAGDLENLIHANTRALLGE